MTQAIKTQDQGSKGKRGSSKGNVIKNYHGLPERLQYNDQLLKELLAPERYVDLRISAAEDWSSEVEVPMQNGGTLYDSVNAAKRIRAIYERKVARRDIDAAYVLLEESFNMNAIFIDTVEKRAKNLQYAESVLTRDAMRAMSVARGVFGATVADQKAMRTEQQRMAEESRLKADAEAEEERLRKEKPGLRRRSKTPEQKDKQRQNRAERAEQNRKRSGK